MNFSKIATLFESKNLFVKELNLGLNVFIWGYFIIRLLFFATHISHYVPPDEIDHFGRCQVYSRYLFLPENSESTYPLGLVTNIPYLYYFFMGKLLSLNFLSLPDLIFLRLMNCVFTIGIIIFAHKWIKLVSSNPIFHLLFLALLTNTPMFSFLGAFVNYDNLTNFFAVMALYYLHLFSRQINPLTFSFWGIALLGGALTKISFLPLIPIFIGIFIYRYRESLGDLISNIKNTLIASGLKEIVAMGCFSILFILNTALYFNNLLQYHRIIPAATQIISEEQAMQNRITARNMILNKYQSGRISYEEAVKETNKINHPGDRTDALYWLKIAKAKRLKSQPVIDRVRFTGIWIRQMLQRTVGIMGHIPLNKSAHELALYQLFFYFFIFICIRHFNLSDANGMLRDALLLTLLYTVVLAHYVNYNLYAETGILGVAVQGRYFFPVLVPFYGVSTYYSLHPFKKKIQILITIIIGGYFVWGDFPYFLKHATSAWFFNNP